MSNEVVATVEDWCPLPGSQAQFVACPVYEALYEGTRGPGKTEALLMSFARFVGKGLGPAWRGIIFRQSYPQLEEVIQRTKLRFHSIYGIDKIKFNHSDLVWTWPGGERLLLRHMKNADGYWNYHGHEYPFIGWEELTNWPDDGAYTAMFACSRSSVPGVPRMVRSTCNPFGIGHNWVKRRFIDVSPRGVPYKDDLGNQRVAIHGNVTENEYLKRADPSYINRLRADTNPNRRRAWLAGDWEITSGGMFDDIWHTPTHELAPFKIPHSWKVDRSFDWGSSKPFWTGWWAQSDGTTVTLADGTERTFPRGSLFLIAEWYGWTGKENEGIRMLATEVGKGIRNKEEVMMDALWVGKRNANPGPADSSIFDLENGNCISDDMGRVGCYWDRADKSPGSRKQGWEKMRQLMANSVENSRDEPHFYVFNTCRQWLRTVPTLPRDEKDPDDVDSRAEDHAGDGTRYRVWNTVRTLHKVAITGT
jgi:hypothetical protein